MAPSDMGNSALSPNLERGGNLFHNLILFGRLLRAAGLDVNPGRLIDLVQALRYVQIGRRWEFYYAARCLLVHNRDDLDFFDRAFDMFWRKPAQPDAPRLDFYRPVSPKQPQTKIPDLDRNGTGEGEVDDDDLQQLLELTATYSRHEVVRHKDFGDLTSSEEQAIKHFMSNMVWNLGQRRTRRRRPGRGELPDLRRGFRKNMRYGGEPLEWPRRQRKIKPRPIVVIADISGSMERYTRLLLHFVYCVTAGMDQPVETFVFSTRLTRITRQLRHKSVDQALAEVSTVVHDWSGGTRIGDALKDFNFNWMQRVLGRGAVVLMISDGWDRGDPELLRTEIGRLQRSCSRLIWLNPLLGSDRYEPLTRGMLAALPVIDDFLPVHNLASLDVLADHLACITAGRRPAGTVRDSLSGAAFVGVN